MKAKAIVVLLLSLIAAAGWGQATSPFAISAQPLISVPLGPALGDGTPFFTIGGGASLRAERRRDACCVWPSAAHAMHPVSTRADAARPGVCS